VFSRKGLYPLLWTGSQAARVKITMSVVPTGLKYCVIPKHIYIHTNIPFTNVAAGRVTHF
jgi:hypothetical protein